MTAVGEHSRFRFSLQAVQAQSKGEWLELVRRTDDAGFDMIVTANHLGGCLSPLLPLATAAEVSDRLRLGVMVLNNDFHHPSVLARSAATLDLLSDGRLELGLGAGHGARVSLRRSGVRRRWRAGGTPRGGRDRDPPAPRWRDRDFRR